MDEARLFNRFGRMALFSVLCALSLFVPLLPLTAEPGGLPGPDLMLCLAVAWLMRRPDYVPAPLLAALFLVADLLTMRPPGLWAGLVVIAGESLRGRQRGLRTLSIFGEIGVFGALAMALTFAQWAILAAFFVDQPGIGRQLLAVPVTVAAYPAVALATAMMFGVRRRPTTDGLIGRARP